MTAKIISGNEVATEIRAELKERVSKLKCDALFDKLTRTNSA